jgi:hypothetical protein
MLYLMIVAPYPHHTHSRSTLNIYKVFQYILHTSSLSISLCSLMKLKHIPVSTQYLCMLSSIWPSIKIKVECSQKPLNEWTGCDISLNWTGSLHHNIPSEYMYSCLCPLESQASLHGMHSLTAREYECRGF